MWGNPRDWGGILVSMEFEVALPLGLLYLTTKKSESQKGKLGGSLRWLFKVYHLQAPET